jgi:putative transposase
MSRATAEPVRVRPPAIHSGRVQQVNRQRWKTRIELAHAIFEYIEGFHNRRRRHSALGWMAPLQFENTHHHRAPGSSPVCP